MVHSTEQINRVRTIVRACRLIASMSGPRTGTPESHKIYYQMLADYYGRLLRAKEDGYFTAAHTIFFPVEVLYAMDIVPMHTELTAWMTALFSGDHADLLTTSSQVGLAPEICSPYRVLTGALAKGSIPRPDIVLWSNLICDNAAKSGELVAHMSGCQGYFIDCPFQQSDYENHYFKEEVREMVSFLEKQSGRKMNRGKLSEGIAEMNKQIGLFRQIEELRRTIPSPFPPQDFLKLFTVDCMFAGQPEATRFLETVHRELTETVNTCKGTSRPERFRIMNLMFPPVLLLGAIEKVSAEYGAVSVADPLLCHWGDGHLDPEAPLDSIIKKMEMNPVMVMHGPLDERLVKTVVDCAIQHRVDGAIHYAHVGCRQSAALIKLLKDALNEIDVPVLVMDCDILDTTVAPEGEVCQKLRQFFELLEER